VNFSLTLGSTGFTGNNIVIYIDSVAGGASDTSMLNDTADGGREAISGVSGNGRTQANFAAGFGADFAISLDSALNGNLFNLSTPTNLGFVQGVSFANPSGTTYTFSLPLSAIGLTLGQSFKFVATLISPTAFRSDETIGTITSIGSNPGFTGAITYSNFNTFTSVVPEPATVLLVGPALLSGMFFIRRRRS
jgi:hypothetical protein